MSFIFAAGRAVLNFIYLFHKLFPVKKKISIISRQSDSPSSDVEMLKEELEKLSPETEVTVSCRMIGSGLKGKISYIFHMVTVQMHLFATSETVVLDGYCIGACMLKHRKDLKIVQMWHAMGALKKFGWAAVGEEEGRSKAVAEGMRMHKNYSVIFVSSRACIEPMARAYDCGESLLKVMPLPRTDLILKEDMKNESRRRIYEEYPALKEKKVILYAPTFRKNEDMSPYIKKLIDAVDYEKYSLVIKLHPLDEEKTDPGKALADHKFNSDEMLSVSDCVITDYSAIVFEAALAGKPIFMYVPDREKYDHERGFLINPEKEIPAFWSEKAEEIMEAIEKEDYDLDKIKAFAQKYVEAKEDNTREMAGYILGIHEKGLKEA